MSIKVFSPINVAQTDKWYNLPTANTVYQFPVSTLPSKGLIDFRVYEKLDSVLSLATIAFLDSANSIISNQYLINPNTSSTNGYWSVVLEVPSNARFFLIGSNDPSYLLAKAVKFERLPLATPIKYTNSQSITIANAANIALLGGGGAADPP